MKTLSIASPILSLALQAYHELHRWRANSQARAPKYAAVWLMAGLASLASGCMSVKSYVDPKALTPKAEAAELKPASQPFPLRVTVRFLTNGKPNARATKDTTPKVVWALKNSRLFSAVETNGPSEMASLELELNNVGNIGGAVGKGVGTGLTLGLVGSGVTDGYVMTATWQRVGAPAVTKTYHHALYSTVGNKAGPDGLQSMSPQEAYYRVVDDLVANLLLDLQANQCL